jgi:hemerythrin
MTTPDTEREKLIKELEELDICYHKEDGNIFQKLLADEVDAIADFIRSRDRRMMQRVVDALKPCKPSYHKDEWHINVDQAIAICKEYL